jgi:ribosomal protein S27AE
MECPRCKANTFKKKHNDDGTHYYSCSACHYKTEIIKVLKSFYKSIKFYNMKMNVGIIGSMTLMILFAIFSFNPFVVGIPGFIGIVLISFKWRGIKKEEILFKSKKFVK